MMILRSEYHLSENLGSCPAPGGAIFRRRPQSLFSRLLTFSEGIPLFSTPLGGWATDLSFERAAKRRDAFISDALGDAIKRRLRLAEKATGNVEAPSADIGHNAFPHGLSETSREAGGRQRNPRRQRVHAPVCAGIACTCAPPLKSSGPPAHETSRRPARAGSAEMSV
jgi:hypothetical protein